MKRLFFSGNKYKIQGVNQERVFSKLSKVCHLYFVRRLSSTQAEVFVKKSNQNQFEKTLEGLNYKIISKKNTGWQGYLRGFLNKIGVVSGLLFCLVFLLLSRFFVFQTEIVGLESINQADIMQVLQKSNYKSPAFKSSIKTKNIESTISKGFDDISLVSAIIKGNTLVISIKEKISAGDYDNLEDLQPLVAKQSGLITSIELISGTLCVEVGQIVQVGDALVKPFIIDSGGKERVVRAEAKITADVWHIGREIHNKTQLITERTGKVFKHNQLSFMGINLSKPLEEPPFSSYEIVSYKSYLAHNNILPIIYTQTVFYQTKTKQIEESFESVKEQLFEKAKQNALKSVEEYEIIKKEYSTVTNNFGMTIVEYIIETQSLIS